MRIAFAWLVHLYTGIGLVLAAWIAILVVWGGDASFRLAFLLMLAATVVDATDGWLARKADVHRWTPGFDGRRLDDLIDFHTYTTLPLLLIWRAGILPPGFEWVLLIPLVASAYGFSQVEAKTADHYFLGFPSYWNIVAFYLYVLAFPGWLALATLLVLGLLTFVPSRYLYPSQKHPLSVLTNVIGSIWGMQLIAILLLWRAAPRLLLFSSLAFPIYYMAVSWMISIRHWRQSRSRRCILIKES